LPVWSSWIITLRSGNLARTRGPSDDPSPVRGSPTHTHAECTTAASLLCWFLFNAYHLQKYKSSVQGIPANSRRLATLDPNPPPPLAHLHPPLPAYTRTPHEELLLVSRLGVPVAKILRDGTSLLLAAAFTDVDDLRPRWDTVGTRTSYRCHPGTQSSSASSAHIVVVVAPRYVWPYCSMLPRCSRHWPSVGPVDDRQW